MAIGLFIVLFYGSGDDCCDIGGGGGGAIEQCGQVAHILRGEGYVLRFPTPEGVGVVLHVRNVVHVG